MSSVSPATVLFDVNGVALAVYNNTAVPAGTAALLFAGYDGYNQVSRYALMGAEGNLGVSDASNNVVVLSNATITANGQDIFTNQFFGMQEINLIVNATVTGTGTTPSLTFTIQEVDPGNGTTTFGNSASTTALTNVNTPGVFTAALNVTTSSAVRVSWAISGAGASFTGVYATITTKSSSSTQTVNGTVTVGSVSGTVAVTQSTSPWVVSGSVTASGTVTANQGAPNTLGNSWPITITDGYGNIQGSSANPIWVEGTIMASNPSTGTDGAAALGFDTQVGGKTTTAAPTYTNGNLDALSLTTLGGLRIDGVYASGTSTATAADLMAEGAYVTQAAPSYSNSTLRALSLDLFGNLRTLADGYVTTVAPSYTNNTPSPLSLDTSGNLRVTGFVTTNKSSSSSVTSVASSTSNTVVLGSNSARLFATIFNSANKTMYVKLGATASTSSYTIQIFSGSYWEVPSDYTGEIDAVWATSPSGNALVTELT